MKEFPNGADFHPQQMGQPHVVHVEQADQTWTGTLMIHTGFYEHEVGFDCFVEVVIGRLGVAQSVEDDGMPGRCRRQEKVVSTKLKGSSLNTGSGDIRFELTGFGNIVGFWDSADRDCRTAPEPLGGLGSRF